MSWKSIKLATESTTKMLERASTYPQDNSKIVHTFPDGWTIRELRTLGDHWREAGLMSNCLHKEVSDSMAKNLKQWIPTCSKCGKTPCYDTLVDLNLIDLGLLTDEEKQDQCGKSTSDFYTMSDVRDSLGKATSTSHPELFKFMSDYVKAHGDDKVDVKYYSIRDPHNLPHITAGQGHVLGRHNAQPKAKYNKYTNELDQFLNEEGFVVDEFDYDPTGDYDED